MALEGAGVLPCLFPRTLQKPGPSLPTPIPISHQTAVCLNHLCPLYPRAPHRALTMAPPPQGQPGTGTEGGRVRQS